MPHDQGKVILHDQGCPGYGSETHPFIHRDTFPVECPRDGIDPIEPHGAEPTYARNPKGAPEDPPALKLGKGFGPRENRNPPIPVLVIYMKHRDDPVFASQQEGPDPVRFPVILDQVVLGHQRNRLRFSLIGRRSERPVILAKVVQENRQGGCVGW